MVVGSAIAPGMDLPLGQSALPIDWGSAKDCLRRQQDIRSIDGKLLQRYKDKLLRSLSTGEAQLIIVALAAYRSPRGAPCQFQEQGSHRNACPPCVMENLQAKRYSSIQAYLQLTGRPKPGTNRAYRKGEVATVEESKAWFAEALQDPSLPEDVRENLQGWLDCDLSQRQEGRRHQEGGGNGGGLRGDRCRASADID